MTTGPRTVWTPGCDLTDGDLRPLYGEPRGAVLECAQRTANDNNPQPLRRMCFPAKALNLMENARYHFHRGLGRSKGGSEGSARLWTLERIVTVLDSVLFFLCRGRKSCFVHQGSQRSSRTGLASEDGAHPR